MEKGVIVSQPVKFPLLIQGSENIKAASEYLKPGTLVVVGFHLAASRFVAADCSFAPEALVLVCQNIVASRMKEGTNARM
jgi:hypothetical protein